MKKLKIILPLLLISLFFNIKVNAAVNYTFVPRTNSTIDTYLSNHTGSTAQDFYKMLVDNLGYTTDYNKYICMFNLANNNVDCHASDSDFKLFAGITGYGGRASLQLLLPAASRTRNLYTITYNNKGEYVSHTTSVTNFDTFSSLSLTDTSNSRIWAIPIISNFDNNTILYDNSYPSANTKYSSFSFNSLVTYNVNSYVNLDDFGIGSNYVAEVYDPYAAAPLACTILPQIGETTNISSITFRITGYTSAVDFPLKGTVKMTSQDDINADLGLNGANTKWETFVDVQVTEGPNFDESLAETHFLSYDYDTKSLYFNYEVTPEDDIETYVDILYTLTYKSFEFKPFFKSHLFIFACQPYGGVISYAYKDDLTDITNSTDSTLMNFLNNGSDPNLGGFINFVKNHDAGPVDSILNLPLNILQAILNKFNSNTCSPVILPLPFVNRNLTLPCVNTLYSQIDGLNTFFSWFVPIASAFILYKYFLFLYRWVDDMLTLRENNHFGGY